MTLQVTSPGLRTKSTRWQKNHLTLARKFWLPRGKRREITGVDCICPGGCFNIKIPYNQYRDCYEKDKMFSQPPNLSHGNPHTWKESLYWNSALVIWVWTSYQIRKIVGCACAGNARTVFPHHRLQRKPLVSDPNKHHGTSVTHVPWCMLGLLTRRGRENVPGIPGACATRNFSNLARGPWHTLPMELKYSMASCAGPWYIQWPWDSNMSWSNWRKME